MIHKRKDAKGDVLPLSHIALNVGSSGQATPRNSARRNVCVACAVVVVAFLSFLLGSYLGHANYKNSLSLYQSDADVGGTVLVQRRVDMHNDVSSQQTLKFGGPSGALLQLEGGLRKPIVFALRAAPSLREVERVMQSWGSELVSDTTGTLFHVLLPGATTNGDGAAHEVQKIVIAEQKRNILAAEEFHKNRPPGENLDWRSKYEVRWMRKVNGTPPLPGSIVVPVPTLAGPIVSVTESLLGYGCSLLASARDQLEFLVVVANSDIVISHREIQVYLKSVWKSSEAVALYGPAREFGNEDHIPLLIISNFGLDLVCTKMKASMQAAGGKCSNVRTLLTECLPAVGVSTLLLRNILPMEPRKLMQVDKSLLVSNVLAIDGVSVENFAYYDYFLNHFERLG